MVARISERCENLRTHRCNDGGFAPLPSLAATITSSFQSFSNLIALCHASSFSNTSLTSDGFRPVLLDLLIILIIDDMFFINQNFSSDSKLAAFYEKMTGRWRR